MADKSDAIKATSSTSTSEPVVKEEKKGKNRRGRGSRNKASERFRDHKNEAVAVDYMSERVGKFRLAYGYTPDQLFGPLVNNISTVRPVQKVIVSTHKLGEVARFTVETLIRACKVPSHDVEFDIVTVQLAASLQLFSKLYYARANTPFAIVDFNLERLAERVYKNIDQSILPIAAMIDQIGAFEFDNQMFIPVDEVSDHDLRYYSFSFPVLCNELGDVVEREKYPFLQRGLVDHAGRVIPGQYVKIADIRDDHGFEYYVLITDREAALQSGALRPDGQFDIAQVIHGAAGISVVHGLIRNGIPEPDEIFRRYLEFLTRCQKKVAYEKLPRLNLVRGRGTASQLVANGQEECEQLTVWCSRVVSNSELYMSGAFELGRVYQDLYSESVCAVRASVDVRQARVRLMQCLSQRVER